MSKRTAQVTIEDVDRIVDADGSVFPPELCGYAAAGVAVYLLEHWRQCQPPLTAAEQRGDIEDAIAVLRRWQATIGVSA